MSTLTPQSVDELGTLLDQDKTFATQNRLVNEPDLKSGETRTCAKEGMSFVTLSPFTPSKQHKQRKLQYRAANFDEMFGPQKWTKYYEIKSPLKDDFKLYNELAEKVGTDVLFRHQLDGLRIIEAANAEQSAKLQELTEKGILISQLRKVRLLMFVTVQ